MTRRMLRSALATCACTLALAAFGPAKAEPPGDSPAAPTSSLIRRFADWVAASGDHGQAPFVIIDKVAAEVAVFGADGAFQGSAPALLGSARGDDSAPGVGERELSSIPPQDRTTPAGRFAAAYGPAWGGRKVLWVDYATAISLHKVVTANPKERRLQRLKTPTPEDNRITFGCINVGAAFYERLVHPAFADGGGVVYVLPESRTLAEVFPGAQVLSPAELPVLEASLVPAG
jgi:hypothetical protein